MKLKPLPSRKVIKALESLGFKKIRQKGSHVFFKHLDGRTTVIPIHKGEDIRRGLLRNIIKDTGLTKDDFLRLIEKN
jgi:predicted RNA binding protein YcfA (HicA-like mRNA interferase family)